jgi:hypothetical protein
MKSTRLRCADCDYLFEPSNPKAKRHRCSQCGSDNVVDAELTEPVEGKVQRVFTSLPLLHLNSFRTRKELNSAFISLVDSLTDLEFATLDLHRMSEQNYQKKFSELTRIAYKNFLRYKFFALLVSGGSTEYGVGDRGGDSLRRLEEIVQNQKSEEVEKMATGQKMQVQEAKLQGFRNTVHERIKELSYGG